MLINITPAVTSEELRRKCPRLLQQAKDDVDSKVHVKSPFPTAQLHSSKRKNALQQRWCLQGPLLGQLKHGENNHNKIAFQASCIFRSSNSLFPKAHLFVSDTVVGLIKSSTWGFASLLRTLQCQRQCLFLMWSLLVSDGEAGRHQVLPRAFTSRTAFRKTFP